jgi:ABC-2 type transport system permease protein
MMKALDIYITSFKNGFAARMAYRADFFFCSIMILVSELLLPMVTFLIYATGASFPGWNRHEALLLQGVFMLSKGVSSLLFFGLVYNTLRHVSEGTYDLFLIKPVSVLFLSIAAGAEPDSIGTILGGILVVLFSLLQLPSPEAIDWIKFVLIFFFSILVMFSFAVIMSGSVFKWVGNSRIYEIFDSITAFGNYPRSIFSKSFQAIISYIIPVAIIGFFPASALLGKELSGVIPAIVVSVLFFLLSLSFWRLMLSKYTSAGG